MDRTLYIKAIEKQNELWDRIFAALSGEWERGWTLGWAAEPVLSREEVEADLNYGRD
jgi:hypothetical protein